MSCIVCNADIAHVLSEGRIDDARRLSSVGRHVYYSQELLDAHCSTCDSRVRLRALAQMLIWARPFIDTSAEILLVSASNMEREVISRFWRRAYHVSLLADWKDPNCHTGVDITDMPELGANQFSMAVALCVLDYIPEAAKAVAEIGRTLRPNGSFVYWIQPFRIDASLGEASQVRTLTGYKDPTHVHTDPESAAAHPAIPDCRFGPRAMSAWARAAGLEAQEVKICDHLAAITTTLHIARKPGE